ANKEENTLEVVESLRDICPVYVTDIVTIPDTLHTIEQFGKLFKRTTDAKKWIDKIQFSYDDFVKYMNDKSWKKSAYLIGENLIWLLEIIHLLMNCLKSTNLKIYTPINRADIQKLKFAR